MIVFSTKSRLNGAFLHFLYMCTLFAFVVWKMGSSWHLHSARYIKSSKMICESVWVKKWSLNVLYEVIFWVQYGKGQSVQLLWVKLSKKESFLILVIFWAGVWWSIFLVWATITIWGLGDLYFTGDLYFWVFSYGSLDWARCRCGSGSRIAGIHDCSYFRVQIITCTRGTILYVILRHWGGNEVNGVVDKRAEICNVTREQKYITWQPAGRLLRIFPP